MMRWIFVVGFAGLLAACHPQAVGTGEHHGRYQGVGIYSSGDMWSHMNVPATRDPKIATTADDEHVIVVIDSVSGEIRQCGDMSGYCVRTNPWQGGKTALPASVSAHAAELSPHEPEATSNDLAIAR